MRSLTEIGQICTRFEARCDLLKESAEKLATESANLDKREISTNQALAFIQSTAQALQEHLQNSLQAAVQASIDILFPGYDFKVEFIPRRNKVEVELYLVKYGKKFNPIESNGGGVVDAVTFALRVGCLKLAGKSKTLLLDEPFKHVRGEPREDLGRILELLSTQMGVQILMVSDVAGTNIEAQKVYSIQ